MSPRVRSALDRLVVAGAAVGAAALLWYLVVLVRDAASPTETYAASAGLTETQCLDTVGGGLSEAQARAFCRRPVPKRF